VAERQICLGNRRCAEYKLNLIISYNVTLMDLDWVSLTLHIFN